MQLTHRRTSVILCVLSTIVLSPPAWAQIVRNGSIAGTIADNTGAALPGVTITVTSPALQVPQLVKVSEGDGTYQFVDLPVGTYRLVYELSGFSTLVREDIRLTTGFAARVDVVLPVATLAETVTVTGQSPLVDVTNTRGGTTATRELLSSMPVNQDFQAVLSLSAGVFIPGVPRQSRVGLSQAAGNNDTYTYGQRTRMNAWVEGIQAVMSSAPDFAASEEVDIKAYGNTAETALPGGNIQVLYKSGGNDFRGTVRGSAQSKRFQSNNVDDALRRQGISAGQDVRYLRMSGIDVGGRIIRNKLWYFGAPDWAATERAETGFAADSGPDGVYLTPDDTAGFRSRRRSIRSSSSPIKRRRSTSSSGSWIANGLGTLTIMRAVSARMRPRERVPMCPSTPKSSGRACSVPGCWRI